MKRSATVALAIMTLAAAMQAASGPTAKRETVPDLTAAQIVDRYVAACGGAEAWRKIQTMAWTGRIESGPGGISKMPFLMLFRRPDSTRFEILKEGQHSVRIFNGKLGWRIRPTGTGEAETKDYTNEEISYARDAGGLDGPLFDFKAKGVRIELLGKDSVEGHPAYRLGVTLPSGRKRTDWIDASSFLDLRYDREMRNGQGVGGVVTVYYRNYQTVEGLTLPFMIETGSGPGRDSDKMVIEKIALNPQLRDSQFTKPVIPSGRHNGVVVDTTTAR